MARRTNRRTSKLISCAGAVVTGVRTHGSSVRIDARAPPVHEMRLDVLGLVLWAICPPASAAEGGPCAGYSAFSLEPCSDLFEPEIPQ